MMFNKKQKTKNFSHIFCFFFRHNKVNTPQCPKPR